MNDFEYRQLVDRALNAVVDGLLPTVNSVLAAHIGPDEDWTVVLRAHDLAAPSAQNRNQKYGERDFGLLVRLLTSDLDPLGRPFARAISPLAEGCLKNLRRVRNDWAHGEPFDRPKTNRAIEAAQTLLQEIAMDHLAEELGEVRRRMLAEADRSATPEPGADVPATDGHAAVEETADAPMAEEPEAAATEPTGPPLEHTSATSDPPLRRPRGAARYEGLAPDVDDAPTTPAPALTIEIDAHHELSYAMANARIQPVTRILVRNTGEELRGASLDLEVVDANGSLGGPRTIRLDLAAGQDKALESVALTLDPARMLAVEQRRPGRIRAVLRTADGDALAESSVDVTVLAANEWKARPLQLGLELLSSFAQPNAAVVATVLREAADLLGAASGRSDLDGYQSQSAERVDQIVEAVWDAVRARGIAYTEPPASWGEDGQKVRTPAEVLEGRLGTCLDTTLTLAAILEQAGINSTLWLTPGHIFLGYWRVESTLGTAASTDVGSAVNLADMEQIRVVETTLLTGESRTLTEAHRLAQDRHLATGPGALVGVADVREARNSGIYPLPSRSVGSDGAVTVNEYTPANSEYRFDFDGPNRGRRRDVTTGPARIATWKNALLDLSLRNRLINYTDRAGFSLAVPGSDLARFEDIVNQGTAVQLIASDSISDIARQRGVQSGKDLPPEIRSEMLFGKKQVFVSATSATYTDKLRKFASSAKTIVEETGANNLYLAFGSLVWTLDNRELRSPMVLVPVTIKETSRGSVFTIALDESGSSTPNFCLVEKLKVSLGLDLPGLANPVEDESGIDLRAAFDSVRATLTARNLPFRVEETVDLAVLQFAKYRLWKDLDEDWETLARNPLVSHLINSPLEPFEDPADEELTVDLEELSASVPVPADASQLEAVAAAVAGKTFVLEGPPGTGKSQTITNLLARALADGKRVLFVAEKRAALDVVKRRLQDVGLGPFCLDLHDKGARPAEARAQIRAALDFAVRPDVNGHASNQLTVEASVRGLRRYADRLHDENSAGYSLYEARQREILAEEHVQPLAVPHTLIENGDSEQFDEIRRALRLLPDASDAARPRPDHPWALVSPLALGDDTADALAAAADELDAALAELDRLDVPTATFSFPMDATALAPLLAAAEADARPLSTLDRLAHPDWDGHLAQAQAELLRIAPTRFEILGWIDEALIDHDLDDFRAMAVEANEAGILSRKKRRREVRDMLAPYLRVDPESVNLERLVDLADQLLAAREHAKYVRSVVQHVSAPLTPDGWSPFDGDLLRRIAAELGVLRRLRGIVAGQGANEVVDGELIRRVYAGPDRAAVGDAVRRFVDASSAVARLAGAPSAEFERWSDGTTPLERWRATRLERGEGRSAVRSLGTWLTLLQQLEPLRRGGMVEARQRYLDGLDDADEALLAFEKGLASTSVQERLSRTGLESFETAAHEKLLGRYVSGSTAVRGELPRIIPAQVLKRRDLSSVPSAMMGGLKRQLEYKLRGMKVRRLMEEYGPLITKIAPCTLMSPESVARFLPVDADLYDIVVFDEASQVRVADAVGALGRARSAVIVGDSKQMPPTSFAETGATEDETAPTDTVVDEESILSEASQARVPSRWLSWHYRSQDERLIAFSNSRYYDSRLSSFPTPHDGDTGSDHDGYGISFVRVDGTFIRTGRGRTLRTNAAEAEAIVADVHRRFAASPDAVPSLGIITFNAQQRDLIDGMLRGSADARVAQSLDVPDGLFVKNLENVQGDERDTILFSIAFSANDKGVVPLQFGPLTRAGGERRWNVAVTRARRQVVLFCSFDPAELRADETQSVGVKHLKAYLQIAQSGFGEGGPVLDRASLPDAHRDELAAALVEAGLTARADIGLSEFRVDIALATAEEPHRPLVAVLLDGPSWRGRRTVSDRDGLPGSVLKNAMGWPAVERVWLPEWLADRDAVIARLTEAVERADAEIRAAREEAAALAPTADAEIPDVLDAHSIAVIDLDDSDSPMPEEAPVPVLPALPELLEDVPVLRAYSGPEAATAPSSVLPPAAAGGTLAEISYDPWEERQVGSKDVLDSLPSPASARQIADLVREIVAAEGPIHEVRAAKLIAGAFELNKVSVSRTASIIACFPLSLRRPDDPQFLWAEGVEPAGYRAVRSRLYTSVERVYEHIDPFEAANAVELCVRASPGIDHLLLVRATMMQLGIVRMTDNIRSLVDSSIADALRLRRVVHTPSGSYTTP
ncbi:DUF3320 domain-containing protein [Rathayibacter sp. VKM Ac-2928]|uniref:DUF3320 domain-containing protein n=1 Tax=Rathayibacter sp. VKM Ac-2928 TaxID=2929479 RepID=UPI001FB41A26|nr:DUF3320 domain-containing protein [Rathayibacter sp. VKM Ac-2928]MCJ1683057.1 DUF3320 domain-containing protein [Rathayibacter sp. VKM Ac-2928]